MKTTLTAKEINDIYKLIERYHKKYLKTQGVRMPKLKNNSGKYLKDTLILVFLAQNYPNVRPVTKTELTHFVRKYDLTPYNRSSLYDTILAG